MGIFLSVSKILYALIIVCFVIFIPITKHNNKYVIYNINQTKITYLFLVISSIILIITSTNEKRLLIIQISLVMLILLIITNFLKDNYLKNIDVVIANSINFLLCIGIVMLMRLNIDLAQKQVNWICISFMLGLLSILIMKTKLPFRKMNVLYLILCYLFLIAPFIFGVKTLGSLNWVRIYGFSFQPSEIVKLIYVFYLASEFKGNFSFKKLVNVSIIVFSFLLILVFQKDLGAALIYFIAYLILAYAYSSKEIIMISGLLVGYLGAYLSSKFFFHVQERIDAWMNPWDFIDTQGYQITQSLFAIIAGKWFGTGLNNGMPYKIPIVEKDFIFSAICEEFGNIFSIMLIAIYCIIVIRGINIALGISDKFYCFLALGISSLFGFQTFLIIGGVIRLIPMTGVTLPFISYGGSSIIINMTMMMIVQYCALRKGDNIVENEK